MGFFTKIFGIDQGIENFTKNLVEILFVYQKYLNNRATLINLLNNSHIQYRSNNVDNGVIHWDLKIGPEFTHFMLNEESNTIFVSFSEFHYSPYTPIKIFINDNKIDCLILYPINTSIDPVLCNIFLKMLNKYGIKNVME